MDKWIFDGRTWLYGTQDNGCGVYANGILNWEGNVSFGYSLVIGIGPFDTKEKAMEECLKKLKEFRDND